MARKKTPNYRYRVQGYDGDWKDWDKLPQYTDHAIQRQFTKKAEAMKAAKEWMAKHPPPERFRTNQRGDTITPYIHIWNMSRGYTEEKWFPEGGQWVDQDTWLKMRRGENPKKASPKRKSNTHDQEKSTRRFHAAMEAVERELLAANDALEKYADASATRVKDRRARESIEHLVTASYWLGQARAEREYAGKLPVNDERRLKGLESSMRQWGRDFIASGRPGT